MYIITCRAHFCHLRGLDQVGHSQRGTSGSARTLDWDPMWSGSQSTCPPQCTPDIPYTPDTPWHPYTPYRPPIPLLALDHLHSLPALQCTSDTPYIPESPLMPPDTPYQLPCPWCPYTPAGPWGHTFPASPPMHPDTSYTSDSSLTLPWHPTLP